MVLILQAGRNMGGCRGLEFTLDGLKFRVAESLDLEAWGWNVGGCSGL